MSTVHDSLQTEYGQCVFRKGESIRKIFYGLPHWQVSHEIVSLKYILAIQSGDVLDPGQKQLEVTCIYRS